MFENQYLVFAEYRSGIRPYVKSTIDFNLGPSFLFEVDVMQKGPSQTDCGLIVSSANEAVNVRFSVSAVDGEFMAEQKSGSGNWVELLSWTASPLIKNGTANKLTIIGYSEGVMVFINDKLAAISAISAIDVQQLGFTVSVVPDTNVTCTFDNLRVYTQ